MWFYRVFYGLATKEIARHPEISLAPAHVDVLLHRVRRVVRDCMDAKGHRVTELPPGTFVEIWRSFGARTLLEGVEPNGVFVDAAGRK